MFPVLIPLRQRLALCFHALSDGLRRWMKPRSQPPWCWALLPMSEDKAELMAENALLRQQLIILHRQVKRPVYQKTDRLLLVLLARMVRTWKQALFLVQPETLLRWHRDLFRLFWMRRSKGAIEQAETLTRDDQLDQGDGGKQLALGAERIRGELLKLNIRRSQTDDSESICARLAQTAPMARPGKHSCATMQKRSGPAMFLHVMISSFVRSLPSLSSS